MLEQLNAYADELEGQSSTPPSDREATADTDDERLARARELAADGRHARAAHYYRHLLEDRSDDATVHHEYADVLAEAGYLESAARHYETAIDIAPTASMHEDFAALLAEKGERRKAARQHQRARSLRSA